MSYDTTQFPYRCVVYITDVIGGQGFQASGVLISPDEVLTASHVVFSTSAGTATQITVTPAFNGTTAPYGSALGTSFHYEPIYNPGDTISADQSQYDYAVIHLSQPFTGLGAFAVAAGFPAHATAQVSGYPGSASGQQVTQAGTYFQYPGVNLLYGPGLGPGSSGGPLWTYSGSTPTVVGIVSTGQGDLGYFTQITSQSAAIINGWATLDDASGGNFSILDTTTGQVVAAPSTPYVGPVAGLQQQCIDITSDSVNLRVTTDNWFLHTGAGTDAIAAHGGDNVLAGGTGSNFLVGGTGFDTFFVDDRDTRAETWSTFAHFHAGDSATVWGVTQSGFHLDWTDRQGAPGFTGLTLHATAPGRPETSLTIAGYNSADLGNGRLAVNFGVDQASNTSYLSIHANG